MNFGSETQISLGVLKEFVYEAKQAGFASTDLKTTLPDQSSVYSYRPFSDDRFRGMIYTDHYVGNTVEAGQESVSIDLALRWRNQYYGGTFISYWDLTKQEGIVHAWGRQWELVGPQFPEIVSQVLKMALLRLPLDFPVRGPKLCEVESVEFEGEKYEGEWKYTNNWKGLTINGSEDPFSAFSGMERIYLNGVEVYSHVYQGGLIRDKYFPWKMEISTQSS